MNTQGNNPVFPDPSSLVSLDLGGFFSEQLSDKTNLYYARYLVTAKGEEHCVHYQLLLRTYLMGGASFFVSRIGKDNVPQKPSGYNLWPFLNFTPARGWDLFGKIYLMPESLKAELVNPEGRFV